MARHARTLRMAAVLAVVGSIGLAGCSSSDKDPEDTTPTLSVQPSSEAPTSESTSATTSGSASASATTSGTASSTTTAPVDLTQPPTTYDQARAHLEALDGGAQETSLFRTKDDIYCVLKSGRPGPACEAPYGGGVTDAEVCANAQSDQVGRIELGARGAVPLCNTDTIRESMPSPTNAPALLKNSGTGIECAVETIGVTCVDPKAKAGFFLAKGRYQVF